MLFRFLFLIHELKSYEYFMKTKILFCLLLTLSVFSASAQSSVSSGDSWSAYKAANGIDPNMTYDAWLAQQNSSSTAPSTPSAPSAPRWTPQQQMALSAAQAAMPALQQAVHNFMNGSPEEQAQLQRQLAATQLNNSGVYLEKQNDFAGALNEFQQAFSLNPSDKTIAENLVNAKNIVAKLQHNDRGLYLYNHQDYAGALDEFQQALALNPSDKTIAQNVVNAKLMLANTATATQESSMLGQLLGSQPPQTSSPVPNANTVDLRNHPSTVLNSLNVNYDTSTVDFRGLGKQNSTEEEYQNRNQQALQRQLDQVFNPIIADSHAVNFSGLGKAQSANSSPPPAQDQQKLKDQLNNVLDANFDGQTHN
jgi:tetratricopeptide (TPR) repeat protein